MASSQDTEITLGTGKLLFLFFGLVGICALFFALGYSLGRKSEPAITTASAATVPQTVPGTNKARGGSTATPPMTFYKSVEQKDANPELTPAADGKTEAAPASASPAPTPSSDAPEPTATLPTGGYFVQVAAVSKQEDADSLVDAAHLLATEPVSVQLRYLQTLTEIGVEKNTTVIFPVPVDFFLGLQKLLGKGDGAAPAKTA